MNKEVIITHEYIYCAKCKRKLESIKELEQAIEDEYEYDYDTMDLFCKTCKEYKEVAVDIEYFRNVCIPMDTEYMWIEYTYNEDGLKKYVCEYLYEGLPLVAPYFTIDKLLVEKSQFETHLDLSNLSRVTIENEGKENCTITYNKG